MLEEVYLMCETLGFRHGAESAARGRIVDPSDPALDDVWTQELSAYFESSAIDEEMHLRYGVAFLVAENLTIDSLKALEEAP